MVEDIKTRMDLKSEAFEILENTHKMGTRLTTPKHLLTTYLNSDQEFSANHLATFVTKLESLTEETWRSQALPFGPKIRQAQVG